MVIGNLSLNGGRPHRVAPTNKGTDAYGNIAIKDTDVYDKYAI